MDKIGFALEVMVVGFAVVMLTLFLLYGILVVFSRIFKRKVITDPKSETTAKNPPTEETGMVNSNLTAVITAAIYSYLESNTPSFNAATVRVTTQPTNNRTANNWQIIGRRQLMEGKAELETTRRNKNREKI